MADFDSSLPVRTQSPGDVVVKVGDATIPTQQLAVDSSGRVTIKLQDGTGNALTSQVNGAQRALDIGINVAGVQIDPRVIRALTASDIVTANQGTPNTAANRWQVQGTDGTNSQTYLATGEAKVSVTQPLPTGANTIGSVNQGTSPWVTKDQADGPVAPGTAAAFSELVGGVFNTALPTLTNGQQSAIQLDASGRIIIRPLTATDVVTSNQGTAGTAAQGWFTKITDGTSTVAVKAASTAAAAIDPALVVSLSPNSPLPAGTNAIGTVKAQLQDNTGAAITLGQKPMATSVPVVLASDQTPIPVTISSDRPGTEICSYNTASALAAAGVSNHDYTVTALKTFTLTQIECTGSGKMKVEIQIETGAATGVFNTRFVQFNSTANTNTSLHLEAPITVAAGVRVRIIRTNRDLAAQDLYSTILGQEV